MWGRFPICLTVRTTAWPDISATPAFVLRAVQISNPDGSQGPVLFSNVLMSSLALSGKHAPDLAIPLDPVCAKIFPK